MKETEKLKTALLNQIGKTMDVINRGTIEWHNYQDNPKDVPPRIKEGCSVSATVLSDRGNKVYYSYNLNKFIDVVNPHNPQPKAWYYLPVWEG